MNWWWPSSTPVEIANTGGLAAVLSGELTLEEAVVKTSKRNLDIYPAGNMPVEKRPPYARSSALRDLIDELSRRYEYLILDIPAITASPDAIPLASFSTACCLVVHQGATLVDEVRTALDDVDHLHLIGVVMNKNSTKIPSLLLKILPH
jgi:Mrp family chromosome partitioning ATPase